MVSPIGEVTFDKAEPIENLITWVYENGSFVPIGKLVDNESFIIVNDYIGRPVLAFDEKGEKVWSAEYDIYGGIRKLQGKKEFILFRQLGHYEDIETGLYYNRFRYYSPESGTYISQNPIGLAGGFTLYGYVKDINKFVDIFGLNTLPLGTKQNPFTSIKQALNRAKELAGIPKSQQPLRQWQVTDNILYKNTGLENFVYNTNKTHLGRMYEYIIPQEGGGTKNVIIVLHTQDDMLHAHAGNAKDIHNFDFKKDPYKKITDPKLGDHHLYIKCK